MRFGAFSNRGDPIRPLSVEEDGGEQVLVSRRHLGLTAAARE